VATLDAPDYETTRQQLVAFAGNRAPELGTGATEFLGEQAGAQAQIAQANLEAIGLVSADAVPSADSSEAGLSAWADSVGLSNGAGSYGPRGPTGAQGAKGQLTGENGTAYLANQLAQATGGVRIKLRANATIPGAPPGSGQVEGTWDVDATDANSLGTKGNLLAGTVCTYISAPAGSDATFVLTQGMQTLGKDQETGPELLGRLQAKMQRPPNGGNGTDHRTWVEEATDESGAPISSAQIVGYAYPNYDGPALPAVVATYAGSGKSRQPSSGDITKISTFVNGSTTTDGKRLAGAPVRVLQPYMPDERALVITCRCLPSLAKYAFDWVRGTTVYQVFAFSIAALPAWVTDAGGNAMLTLTALAPASLKEAIDAGQEPRIYGHWVSPTALLGPVIPEQAPCLAWQDSAGIRTQLALKVSNATSWNTWVQANNEVFAGGPIVDAVAQAILDSVNARGPSRVSGLADPAVSWQDTISLTTVSTAAETALDEDGVTRLVDRTITEGVIINVGFAGTAAITEVRASDNTVNGPEILYAGRILVTD